MRPWIKAFGLPQSNSSKQLEESGGGSSAVFTKHPTTIVVVEVSGIASGLADWGDGSLV